MAVRNWLRGMFLVLFALVAVAPRAQAQADTSGPTKVEVYGFAMLDMGYDFNQNDPAWFDVVRPTKLPSFEDEFGKDGRFYAGVRQSRLGVKMWTPTSAGKLYTVFEFEMFGVGVDAGQTTIRLRHAYGELGHFGAGQTWSPFMDIDVFPNTVEYWGPTGMAFFRNVQFRWMPKMGATAVTLALERPGASGDPGDYGDRVELSGIQTRLQYPDLSAHVRFNRDWGHVQLAGIVRSIKWDDTLADAFELGGDEVGWGFNASTNLKIKKDTFRGSVVYGEGVENYMNDAPVDIGIQSNGTDPVTPVVGKPLPLLGISAFYDRTWSEKWTSSFGYSRIDIDNSDLQSPSAFHLGQYAVINMMYYPAKNVMLGPEFQWGSRENNSDGFISTDRRVQFSAKYNFSHIMGGE